MMLLEKFYFASPWWLQNVMCTIKGYCIKRRRYNKLFYKELYNFENNKYDPQEELRQFLLKLKNVSAYKHVLTRQVIKMLESKNENVYDILKEFPIIDKAQVKERLSDYVNNNYIGKFFIMQTSGTTGNGLAFPYPIIFENRQWALWWRYRRSLGIKLDTWCGWFGGKRMMSPNSKKPPYWRINKPGHQIMYSSYHLTKDTVKLFYDDIHKRSLLWLHGYPSHLAKLSALILENGLKPLNEVKWITTGAEGLVGNQKHLIERAFPNAVVRSHYGQNEGVAIMNQNELCDWYIESDFSYVEFIPVNPNEPELCRIVGTGFFNLAFPLVRYDTGDLAKVERDVNGNIVKIVSIDGRTSNTIKQPSGHEITEAALSIVLHDFYDIIEAQFHQISINEVDLWVVKGNNYNSIVEKKLKQSLSEAFDNDMTVNLKYVKAAKRTKAGKLRLVIPEFDIKGNHISLNENRKRQK